MVMIDGWIRGSLVVIFLCLRGFRVTGDDDEAGRV
jgi:hypothetical protein